MHIESNPSLLGKRNGLKRIIEYLCEIFPEEYIKIRLDLTTREIREILRTGNCNAMLIPQIAEGIGVNVENIFLGQVDLHAISSKWFNELYIPKKYQIGAFTNAAVTKNVLEIIKKIGGKELLEDVLKYMQTSFDYFERCDPESKISTLFNSDVYYYLKKYKGFSDQDLFDIGLLTYEGYRSTDFYKSFQGLSIKDAYAKFLEEVSAHIEKSFSYKLLKLNDDKVVIEKRFSEQMQDALGTKSYSNHEGCIFSIGFCASIPLYAGFSPAKGTKSQCIFENNESSIFDIDISGIRPHFH